MSFEFSAPAKIILFGEHAVVYGQPAIAVPVSSVRVYAVASLSECPGLRILARDLNQEISVTSSGEYSDQSPLAWVVGRTLREFGIPALSGEIDIRSEIPLASGLGSGAAISAVLVRSTAALGGVLASDQLVNSLVFEAEGIYHGNPSGVDNTVIVFERGLFFRRKSPFVTMTMRNMYRFLIADTGVRASTKIAVDAVRRLYEQETGRVTPILEEIGKITTEARMLLEDSEDHQKRLGRLMIQNHTLLQALQVSSPELDRLTEAAVNAGAAGAKLSGGGMGGNMIALVDDSTRESVSRALIQAGAARVIYTTVGETG